MLSLTITMTLRFPFFKYAAVPIAVASPAAVAWTNRRRVIGKVNRDRPIGLALPATPGAAWWERLLVQDGESLTFCARLVRPAARAFLAQGALNVSNASLSTGA